MDRFVFRLKNTVIVCPAFSNKFISALHVYRIVITCMLLMSDKKYSLSKLYSTVVRLGSL